METMSLSAIIARISVIIIVPVAVLVPLAVYVDKKYGSLPMATLGALFVSACISALLLARIIKK
ncbi:MAG: hypothetical protein AAB649_05680 [Patescibacteria group bacterium]